MLESLLDVDSIIDIVSFIKVIKKILFVIMVNKLIYLRFFKGFFNLFVVIFILLDCC